MNLPLVLVLSLSLLSVDAKGLIARTNSSSLCSKQRFQSCSHFFPNVIKQENCQVNVANSTFLQECNNHSWDQQELCQNEDGCGVHLEVYRHTLPHLSFFRTAFNLSLSGVSHPNIRVRYRDRWTDTFSFCINFTLHSNIVPLLQPLWYDCVFHKRNYEDQPFMLEFHSQNRYGAFLFQIPTEKGLASGQGFLYVHLHLLPQLIITFQSISQVCPTEIYSVVICKWHEGQCFVESQQQIDLKNSSWYRWRTLATVSFDRRLSPGNYSVMVKDANCVSSPSCYQAVSPPFIINDSGLILFLPILGLFLTILLILSVTIWKKILANNNKRGDVENNVQTMLLVYDPTTSEHRWLEAVRIFLSKYAGLEVWLDFIDIPQSEHKDPLIWYSTAMAKADVVAVVLSSTRHFQPPSIYHHTFDLAMELLAARIIRRLSKTTSNRDLGVLRDFIVLESTGDNCSLPEVCSSFTRFRIPHQVDDVVRHISRNNGTSITHCPASLSKRLRRPFTTDADTYFQLIYERLCREESTPGGSSTEEMIPGESFSLLDDDDVDETSDERREHLDCDFGPVIVSVDTLVHNANTTP